MRSTALPREGSIRSSPILQLCLFSVVSLASCAESSPAQGPPSARLWITAVQGDRPVTDLKKEDLKLWVGKQEEAVSRLTFNPPLILGLLIDVSGSQKVHWPDPGLDLAAAFLQKVLHPDDQAFVVSFDGRSHLDAGPTSDIAQLGESLRRVMSLEPRSATALYDTISASCKGISAGAAQHRVLLMFSDGVDDISRLNREQTEQTLGDTGTTIYFVNTASAGSHEGEGTMSALARVTGGMVLPGRDRLGTQHALDAIVAALQGGYALEFEPSGPVKRKSKIRIECLRPGATILCADRY